MKLSKKCFDDYDYYWKFNSYNSCNLALYFTPQADIDAPKADLDADVDVRGPKLDIKLPSFKFGGGGKGKVKKPKVDGSLSGSISGSGPDIKVKGPKVEAPKGDVDVDLNLGGGADLDVKGPDVDVDVKAPKADVDLNVGGDVDIKGPDVKVCLFFHFATFYSFGVSFHCLFKYRATIYCGFSRHFSACFNSTDVKVFDS